MPFDPVFPEHVAIEFYDGSSWVELEDVVISSGITIHRGVNGTTYRDRVAATGTMSFVLNNAEDNSGGLLGYYSPNNVNVRSDWRIGVPVRLVVTFLGIDYSLFYGKVRTITPISGKFGERKVEVSCVDWMDEAARAKVKNLDILLDVRSDEVFTEIMNSIERQPFNGFLAQIGGDFYPYALDSAFGEQFSAMSEFQRLAQSEQGYIYASKDGRAIFESRHKRPNTQTLSAELTDDDIDEVSPGRGIEAVVNQADTVAHPRRIDAAATSVLFALGSVPQVKNQVTSTFQGLYRDPDARATRVGGLNMVQPVASTDYLFNSAADGSGIDLTSQLTVSAVYAGNSAVITVTNNGPFDGYLTQLQCRGRGVYSYETIVVSAASQASKDRYGEATLTLDMPYQADFNVAKDASEFIVNQAKDVLTQVDSCSFWANREERLMLYMLQREVSDKVRVEETVIGHEPFLPVGETEQEVDATGFFVNSIDLTIYERGIVRCTWGLTPADPYSYWILERDGFTELGITTRLGYGAFIAGWVLDDSELGTTTRVNQ